MRGPAGGVPGGSPAMSVIMADRMLAVRSRIAAPDAHGDQAAGGFGPPGTAYPGIANIGPDVPLYQPGGRTWTLVVDDHLWPVNQQDLIVDVNTGDMWQVTSADLIRHTIMPLLDHIEIEAHSYTTEGTKA